MSVNFAAVHEHKSWRKHSAHSCYDKAVNGPDGAIKLLRRIGRVKEKWEIHGCVYGVFVWLDSEKYGEVFRNSTQGDNKIESVKVPIDYILNLNSKKCCNLKDIDFCFNLYTDTPLADTVEEYCFSLYPDELSTDELIEGASKKVFVNVFERSNEARELCIKNFGCICQVCDFDFEEKYGDLGKGFIHIHHKIPISSLGDEYIVNPIEDLIPVCPNCHAMLHKQRPPLECNELRMLIKAFK